MGFYSEVRSEHLRQAIAATPWADRKTIDDLIRLHRFLTEGYHGLGASMGFAMLRDRYPHDYWQLLREVSEERYERELARERERREARQRETQAAAQRRTELRADWESAGGQP